MARIPSSVPILSAGRHRTARSGACFMEFASYLAGERFSDHPGCTHPLLAALARDVNDLSSDAARDDLLPLVHRVVGLRGDDLRITTAIALRAAAAALPVASLERQRPLAVGMLAMLAEDDRPAQRAIAATAFAQAPDTERWASAYLAGIPRRGRVRQAADAIVHTAAIGIALACVDDADARLAALLRAAIEDAEALIRGPSARAPEPVLAG